MKNLLKTLVDIAFIGIFTLFGAFFMWGCIDQYKWWSILIIPSYLVVGFISALIIAHLGTYIDYIKKTGRIKGYFKYLMENNSTK
jgi:hypothetical protein